MARHKHADLIHAWAEGAEIEIKCGTEWFNTNPTWHPNEEYRIKPRTVKHVGWVNIFSAHYTPYALASAGHIYETKEIAETKAKACVHVVATAKVEWEETI